MKKVIKVCLMLLMICSMISIDSVNATFGDDGVKKLEIGEQFCYDSFEYEVSAEGKVDVIGYTGDSDLVKIPESISYRGYGYSVVGINWISSDSYIKHITIPSNIRNIEAGCIRFLAGLIAIDVSSDNQYYSSSEGVLYNKSQTQLIKVPARIISFTLPDSVADITYYAFDDCISLTSIDVDINNEYYSSHNGAVFNKDKTELIIVPKTIKEFTIPDSVTDINTVVFDNCTNLTNINVDINNEYYSSHNGAVFNKDKTELIIVPKTIKEFIIPDSVTIIGDNAFHQCTSLTSINVDRNSEYYSSYNGAVFSKDKTVLIIVPKAMKEFTIPDSVSSIEFGAFSCCTSLTSVTIPTSVTNIENAAFYGCTSLTNIIIPNSVTKIGSQSFDGCTSLTNVVIPDNVTSIEVMLFNNCISLSNITIPNSVTTIEESAFQCCTSLTNITIPVSVISIANDAFLGCINLTLNVYKDSYAEKYAKENGLIYKIIETDIKEITSIFLEKTSLSLHKGSSITLNATINPSDATNKALTWTSSNPNVVAVDQNGRVTAMNTGIAIITVTTSNGKTATCTVTVTNPIVSITSISLDKTNISLNKGSTATLKATINPTDATDSKTLTWTTSNSRVVSVNNGVVKGVGVGTAIITVRTVNGKTATCKVTVQEVKTPTKPKVSITKTKITVKNATYTGKAIKQKVTIKDGKKTLKNGTDYTLSYKNNKNTGKATITIKGKGNYTGSKSINFYIVPKKVTISSIKPGKKQLTVKYKKVTGASGYQIAYSTSKSKGFKYITVNSKTASKVIKKLKSKKNYYVKVRAYKTVGKKKYYGAYSKLKNVKVK